MFKKLKIFYLLVIPAMFFLSCEDKITSSQEDRVEKNFTTIYGVIYDVVNLDTLITDNPKVTVNDSSFIAFNGHYHLERFYGDSLNVKIETGYHHNFDTTFIIADIDSLEMDIELKPIKLEVYPLYQGNEWKYNIDIKGATDRSGNKYTEKGIETNYISRVESDEIKRVFYFEHSYEGYRKTNSDSIRFEYKGTYSVIEYLSTSKLIWRTKPTISITGGNQYLIDGIIDFDSSIEENSYPMQRFLPSSRVKSYGTAEYVNNNMVQVYTSNYIMDEVYFNIGLRKSRFFSAGNTESLDYKKTLISLTSN